jgi:hypothetical protein
MPSGVGVAAIAVALLAHAELLQRLRAAEPARPWWFGYARDGVNLAAALMSWGGYLMLGFPSAEGLLAGLLTTVAVYLLDWAVARGLRIPHPRVVLALPLLAWVAALALAPAWVQALFDRLLALGKP